MSGPSGRSVPTSRRNEPRKSFGLAGGRPMPMPIMPPPGRAAGAASVGAGPGRPGPPGAPGPPGGAGPPPRRPDGRSCRGLLLGHLRVHDLAIGLVALEQLAVRADCRRSARHP